jgi:hypothetical protein
MCVYKNWAREVFVYMTFDEMKFVQITFVQMTFIHDICSNDIWLIVSRCDISLSD